MPTATERTKILEMIADGTITAEDGVKLLNALDEATDESILEETNLPSPPKSPESKSTSFTENSDEIPSEFGFDETSHEPEDVLEPDDIYHPESMGNPPDPDEIKKWKRWWVLPMWVGVGITVIGGALMYSAFASNGLGFWFACAWFPFTLGVLLMALAWGSRTAPWLHVRIQQRPGQSPQKIAISFPLPIRLTGWLIRTFGHFSPEIEGVDLKGILVALDESARDGTPFFVDVDDEDGERVQVYIG
jgi:hypothetical protein